MSSYNEKYNIALDCIDKHAQSLINKNKTALIAVGAHGSAFVADATSAKEAHLPLRLTFANLQDFAAKNLAKYKVPRQIIFLRELPKTQSGKIKRKPTPPDSSSPLV